MEFLSGLFNSIQSWLLPGLEDEFGELTQKQMEFVRTVELINPLEFIDNYEWKGIGRKPSDRLCLIKAFIAKPIHRFTQTSMLIDAVNSSPVLRRLCGWESCLEIPSEATFSRAFSLFAETDLPQRIHGAMIAKNIGKKLFGHKSTDATSVKGREKACRKNTPKAKKKGKRGRPRKGVIIEKEPKRLELQPNRTFEENLSDLPYGCDWGVKKNSKGKTYKWRGYKLHLDCVDGDIPVSAIVTSASVHDSQIAIPLSQMSENRIINLYDLMDAAYDAPEIHSYSRDHNRIPIIDHNPRRGIKKQMDPAKALRYNERSGAERVNSELKDNYALESLRVQGQKKVACQIMFAVIALTAKKIFNLLPQTV
jgi:hypothetical protein